MLFSAVLAPLALPLLAVAAPLEKKSIDNARFTWYDTSVGLGACGRYNPNWKKTVALNTKDYNSMGAGYPAGTCGKKIWIQLPGSDKKLWAAVADECPTCPDGGVDLSKGLFSQLASLDEGVLRGSWGWSKNAWSSRDVDEEEEDFEDA